MRSSIFYRWMLLLYPPEFRQQFSEEMILVFEQRVGERFSNEKSASFAYLLREFVGIVKGAYVMWLSKALPINHNRLQPDAVIASAATLTAAEATTQREIAIENMLRAIAEHDFVNARRYSDEEARLKILLQEWKDASMAAQHTLA